jgi:hypothetical protein
MSGRRRNARSEPSVSFWVGLHQRAERRNGPRLSVFLKKTVRPNGLLSNLSRNWWRPVPVEGFLLGERAMHLCVRVRKRERHGGGSGGGQERVGQREMTVD